MGGAGGAQGVAGAAGVGGEREQQVLGRDVLVAELPHLALGGADDLDKLARTAGRLAARAQLGKRVERRTELLAHGAGLDPELAQHGGDDTLLLLEQDREQVLGGRLRVTPLIGQLLGGLQRLLGFDRESVWLHSCLILALVRK